MVVVMMSGKTTESVISLPCAKQMSLLDVSKFSQVHMTAAITVILLPPSVVLL